LKSRRLAPPHAVFSRIAPRRALTWINPEPEPVDSLVHKKAPDQQADRGQAGVVERGDQNPGIQRPPALSQAGPSRQ
jgi:hypothetical protein